MTEVSPILISTTRKITPNTQNRETTQEENQVYVIRLINSGLLNSTPIQSDPL